MKNETINLLIRNWSNTWSTALLLPHDKMSVIEHDSFLAKTIPPPKSTLAYQLF